MKTLAQRIIDKAIDGGYFIYDLPKIAGYLVEDAEVISVDHFSFQDNEHMTYEFAWFTPIDGTGLKEEGDVSIREIASQHSFARAFFGERWKKHLQEMVLEEDWVEYLSCYL